MTCQCTRKCCLRIFHRIALWERSIIVYMFTFTLENFPWFLVSKRSNYKQSETMEIFFEKMTNESEESELSGDEDFDDLGHFNIVNVQRNERADLERQFRDLVGESDDESDFEGFEPEDSYEAKDFDDWEKVENGRNIVEFNERTGPRRVLDGSRIAADYFQLFYTDNFLPTS